MQHHVDDEQTSLLRGYLVIHVAGYKMILDHAAHIISSGSDYVVVPDRFVKAELHPVGSMAWCEEGWAVGDNPRERFCKWNWVKAMRKFYDFDEAVTYIYRLRQRRKRPNEAYTLVYFLKGVGGKECFMPVSSLDDIAEFENQIAMELDQQRKDDESKRLALENEYPELERLTKSFGARRAFQLSALLKTIRQDGKDKAMQNTSRSTYYRDTRALRELGLTDNE